MRLDPTSRDSNEILDVATKAFGDLRHTHSPFYSWLKTMLPRQNAVLEAKSLRFSTPPMNGGMAATAIRILSAQTGLGIQSAVELSAASRFERDQSSPRNFRCPAPTFQRQFDSFDAARFAPHSIASLIP